MTQTFGFFAIFLLVTILFAGALLTLWRVIPPGMLTPKLRRNQIIRYQYIETKQEEESGEKYVDPLLRGEDLSQETSSLEGGQKPLPSLENKSEAGDNMAEGGDPNSLLPGNSYEEKVKIIQQLLQGNPKLGASVLGEWVDGPKSERERPRPGSVKAKK